MSFNMVALQTWVKSVLALPEEAAAVTIFPDIPDMPDLLICLQAMPAGSETHDGLFEFRGLNVIVRGKQVAQVGASPEDVAQQLDKLLLFGDYPHQLWGDHVTGVQRAGGGPAPEGQLDKGRRQRVSCAYLVHSALL